jgi:molybdopterin-containing oxidoreductase family iron-sulfur binding subunit
VQRIQNARIQAKNEFAQGQRDKRTLSDGEVVTACQQACPTQAIRFGDLNDPNSLVSKAHRDSRAYAMLEETNIKPRTRYLARIRNRPASDAQMEDGHGHG